MYSQQPYRVDSLQFNCAVGPASGPPLVVLHGIARRWQDFVPVLPALAQSWQVFGLDARGHGGSDRGDRYRVADYVGDVGRFLEEHLHQPAVLFGHSLGALVATGVAAQSPNLVRAIILEDPPSEAYLRGFRQTTYHGLFQVYQQLVRERPSVAETAARLADVQLTTAGGQSARLGDVRDACAIRLIARCLQDLDPAIFDAPLAGDWLVGFFQDEVLAKVGCPALLLRGDERAGGMLPRADADRQISLMKDCTRIELPGIGHQIHWMATDATLRYVLSFLESLD